MWALNLHRSKPATQYPAVHKSQVGVCTVWDSISTRFSVLSPCQPPCLLFTDENCRDRHHNCVMVVQARLCVYSYYKNACCASCTQSAQRAKRHWQAHGHNHRQPRCGASQGKGQRCWWLACWNRQPGVHIIPAMAARNHLAIFSWHFR